MVRQAHRWVGRAEGKEGDKQFGRTGFTRKHPDHGTLVNPFTPALSDFQTTDMIVPSTPGELDHTNPLQCSCLEKSMDRSLAGYCPRGHEESHITERLNSRHTYRTKLK